VKELTSDGGVIKTVATEGTGWEVAKSIDGAVVSYSATALGGDASAVVASGDHVELPRVSDAPCKGMARALCAMKAGETAHVLLRNVPGEGGVAYVEGLAPGAPPAVAITLTLHAIQKVEHVAGTEEGVTKRIITPGTGYERPNEGAAVTVKLTGVLADPATGLPTGATFAPEAERSFNTDDEAVPEGLDKAIMTMHKGEVALVTITAPAWGFGAAGDAAAGVPPGAAVCYTVTLLEFTKDKESWDLKDGDEKVAYAEAKKGEGNALFAGGKPARAARRYAKALKMIEYDTSFPEPAKKASKALKAALHSNAAACALKAKDFGAAVAAATKALELDGSATKARFRRAQALMGLGEHFDAELELKKARASRYTLPFSFVGSCGDSSCFALLSMCLTRCVCRVRCRSWTRSRSTRRLRASCCAASARRRSRTQRTRRSSPRCGRRAPAPPSPRSRRRPRPCRWTPRKQAQARGRGVRRGRERGRSSDTQADAAAVTLLRT
jgi:FK506-binding protein 4/5